MNAPSPHDATRSVSAELRKASEAATPGPWLPSKWGYQILTGDSWETICTFHGDGKDYRTAKWEDGRGPKEPWSNADFVAGACNFVRDLLSASPVQRDGDVVEALRLTAECLERPLYNPLEAGFRHSPLTLRERAERFEQACTFAAQDIRNVISRLEAPAAMGNPDADAYLHIVDALKEATGRDWSLAMILDLVKGAATPPRDLATAPGRASSREGGAK